MKMGRRIRLLPTPEQEIQFRKSLGTARWSYNYFLSINFTTYDTYLTNGKVGTSFISEGDVRKYINNNLKPTTHQWLKEVGSNVMKQAVKDANDAFKRYFKGEADKPKYKSKHKNDISFYVNAENLRATDNGFIGERLGEIRTAEPLPKIEIGKHYSNPRISYDGKYYYLSISYEVNPIQVELTDNTIGIDVGVKDLAICSDGSIYKNINKTKRVRDIEKRLKRAQRSLSRMLEDNTSSYKTVGDKRYPIYKRPLSECKNIQKQKKKIKLIYRKLANIRNNYLHQTTTKIVKTKPSCIVIEDLNVSGMMKNSHLSKAMQDQKLHEFRRQITYKSSLYGIQLILADRFYPSSKMCSCCGDIKKDLKLKDRTYNCEQCGLSIDRDYNASINLANYKST